ncbi:MAG: PEGA domain-containing protein, partial [Elusimicrobia bacterium]|nr:PEGA domain-containing protein [Elusimicrobiota bacterium]
MSREWIVDDRYLVLDKIADGGLASVYKAWDRIEDGFVAIKKIHDELADDAKFVDMFRAEAVNTKRLRHKNIVRVLDFVRDKEGGYFMIMELVRGADLEYMLGKFRNTSARIPTHIALYITAEIIKGLGYAHAVKDDNGNPLNMVHRDVTPGNIMLFYEGDIKLADFGVARAGERQKKKSKKAGLVGKIAYMSPEQARGEIGIDGRSDLFGCGLILYEMLVSGRAYGVGKEEDILSRAKSADIDFRKLDAAGVAKEIVSVVKRLLEKTPEKRYPDAVQAYIELKRFLRLLGRTEQLKNDYKKFISEIFKEEMRKSIKEIVKDSKKDLNALFKKAKEKESRSEATEKKTDEEKELKKPDDSEKVKSFRESAAGYMRRYRNPVFHVLVFISLAAVIFTTLDTYFHFTGVGMRVFYMLWPPSLKIDSIPAGAHIELTRDGEDIVKKGGYSNKTPLVIEKVEPGIYTLRLTKKNFRDVVRKVNVYDAPREGSVISIAGSRLIDGIFFIPFEVPAEINSFPQGADIYIDGKKAGKTPYKGMMEIGKHNILLAKRGYSLLGSERKDVEYEKGWCVVDIRDIPRHQDGVDQRFWTVQTRQEDMTYFISGTMWKEFYVYSDPPGAGIFVDGGDEAAGITPAEGLPLVFGFRKLEVKKDGYEDWSVIIDVDKSTSAAVSAVLQP